MTWLLIAFCVALLVLAGFGQWWAVAVLLALPVGAGVGIYLLLTREGHQP